MMHVPPGYGRDAEGRLLIAGRTAEAWVEDAGDTPLFLYDAALLDSRVARFRAAMPPGLLLHYAVKANPFPPLLAHMALLADGFDIASAGELDMALAAGMPAAGIGFAGPGKRDRELAAAIAAGAVLHIESAGELARTGAIAEACGTRAKVALRVNPPFQLRGSGMRMGGTASPFGVDAAAAPDLLAAMRAPQFEFRGFHVYAGSQALDPQAIIESQRLTVALVAELAAHAPVPPPVVNLGGGFGVPYFPNDTALDVEAVGAALRDTLASRPPVLAGTVFAIELGRWLVAEAGVYVSRVIDRKQSGGEAYLVLDGGLHHQLAATGNFGTVIRRNYPLANASRDGATQAVTIVGCLCTPLDRFAERVPLAESRVGDLIAVFMAGAYGRTASPQEFLGHPPAIEHLCPKP